MSSNLMRRYIDILNEGIFKHEDVRDYGELPDASNLGNILKDYGVQNLDQIDTLISQIPRLSDNQLLDLFKIVIAVRKLHGRDHKRSRVVGPEGYGYIDSPEKVAIEKLSDAISKEDSRRAQMDAGRPPDRIYKDL